MDAETLSTIILLGSFLILVLMRFPIAYAVGISTVLCMISMGQNLVTLPQQMVKGVWSFSLMAVPFFITMGVLMGTGGISDKLIALANSLVGWMRGGLAMVNIVASYFFGGISGSAAADTASLGSILIPMMVDEGYDADFSTAVTITSSCEGLLVPPSHNMVIYAMTAGGISVGALFMAGYLPGALLAVALMIGSYVLSVKRNYPKGEKFSLKGFGKQIVKSFWALAAVLIVVFGVVGGVFTATESAAIAVVCHERGLRQLPYAAACAGKGRRADHKYLQQSGGDYPAAERDPAGSGHDYGHGPDYPDCDAYPAAGGHECRHSSGPVRNHDGAELRYRPADAAGRRGALHRIGCGKTPDGKSGPRHAAVLSVHAGGAAADFLHSGDQPLAAAADRREPLTENRISRVSGNPGARILERKR